MAFSGALRRAASRAVPVAARFFRPAPRCNYYHSSSAVLVAVSRRNCGGFSSQLIQRSDPSALRYFSAPASDKTLISVLNDEIKYAQDSTENTDEADAVPENFPFKLEDHPGQTTVTLTRTHEGEQITVEVNMPSTVTGNYEEEDTDKDNDTERSEAEASQLPLVVRVSKDGGPCLEFGCTAYPDEITIDSLSVKDSSSSEDQLAYEGPEFSDLDENLQKAFHKYLEIRGIKPSATNFLHEYMINKDNKEYLVWLKSLKSFIQA